MTASNLTVTSDTRGPFTDLWYVVVPPLPLLLLQFDGDSSDRTPLDPLHQMCHIPETVGTNDATEPTGSNGTKSDILSASARVRQELMVLQTREKARRFFFLYYQ